MPDQKITQLTALATPATEDLIPIVDDPSGSPIVKKVTLGNLLLVAYPVGAVYISVVSTSPATLFGGTWSAFGAGKVLVGLDSGDTSFDTVEETGGAKTHTLTTTEIPAHNHVIPDVRSATTGGVTTLIARTSDTSSTAGSDVVTSNSGSGGAHNNLQPYVVVYMWKRTA